MIKRFTTAFVVLFIFIDQSSFACDIHGKTGIAPENNMWIGPNVKKANMSEKRFREIIEKVGRIYRPTVEKLGRKLIMKSKWESGVVNAWAHQIFGWNVIIHGGLARHPAITEDGLALVVCHEIGHHLGGAPKVMPGQIYYQWNSNEGQADYFASLKCLRKYMEGDDNVSLMESASVPEEVKTRCSDNFADPEEVAMCERGAMAGMSLASFIADVTLSAWFYDIKFDTPDNREVSRTFDDYPSTQCRLDTFFAGALCNRDHNEDVDSRDPNLNTCNRRDGDADGLRPLCWYNPRVLQVKPWWRPWSADQVSVN